MTKAEEWYEQKIAIFTKEKEELAAFNAKISEYEEMVNKLRTIKRDELLNGAVVFNCKPIEAEGEENQTEPPLTSFKLETEDDIKLLEDIRCLMIFELQKRIGKLKDKSAIYDQIIMGRETILDGISKR
jgi:hypothetical protein